MNLELLSCNKAAKEMGISRNLIAEWINKGLIAVVRLPGHRGPRIRREHLEKFVENYTFVEEPIKKYPRITSNRNMNLIREIVYAHRKIV